MHRTNLWPYAASLITCEVECSSAYSGISGRRRERLAVSSNLQQNRQVSAYHLETVDVLGVRCCPLPQTSGLAERGLPTKEHR